MSRERASEPAAEWTAQLDEAWKRFREGRLYVQAVLAMVLVGATWTVSALPSNSLARARVALRWVTHHDYDFAGQAARADAWARRRGGWGRAAAGEWQAGRSRVEAWAKAHGFGLAPQAATPPAVSTATQAAAAPAAAAPAAAPVPAGPAQGSPTWALPVAGTTVLYGYGWLPGAVSDKLHEGIDFAAPVAAPVVAVSDGTVTRIAADPRLGYMIEVKHGALTAVYGQVTAIRVQKGDQVQRGQALAVVGTPAGAEKEMPPHLHFAVRPAGKQTPVDPAFYLGLGGNKH